MGALETRVTRLERAGGETGETIVVCWDDCEHCPEATRAACRAAGDGALTVCIGGDECEPTAAPEL